VPDEGSFGLTAIRAPDVFGLGVPSGAKRAGGIELGTASTSFSIPLGRVIPLEGGLSSGVSSSEVVPIELDLEDMRFGAPAQPLIPHSLPFSRRFSHKGED
jgi:hypothetical protein